MSGSPVFIIEMKKIVEYLLNESHPAGGSKARFFRRHGFDASDPEALASSLVDQAKLGWPGEVTEWPEASRHQIDARLPTPDGRNPEVRSVWERRFGGREVRLLTAYPNNRRDRLS